MIESFADRQQDLLKVLLKSESGLSIDEVASRLRVTRPTARKHLVSLERSDYVIRGEWVSTGGRPSQLYRLGPKGQGLFPKQYSFFSGALLATLKRQAGSAGLEELMHRLGHEVATEVAPRVEGPTLSDRVRQTAKLM